MKIDIKVIAAKKAGIKNIIVPKENIHEASLVKEINMVGFNSLREVVEFLEGEGEYNIQHEANFAAPEEKAYPVWKRRRELMYIYTLRNY